MMVRHEDIKTQRLIETMQLNLMFDNKCEN